MGANVDEVALAMIMLYLKLLQNLVSENNKDMFSWIWRLVVASVSWLGFSRWLCFSLGQQVQLCFSMDEIMLLPVFLILLKLANYTGDVPLMEMAEVQGGSQTHKTSTVNGLEWAWFTPSIFVGQSKSHDYVQGQRTGKCTTPIEAMAEGWMQERQRTRAATTIYNRLPSDHNYQYPSYMQNVLTSIQDHKRFTES